jgi:hypothetical protein
LQVPQTITWVKSPFKMDDIKWGRVGDIVGLEVGARVRKESSICGRRAKRRTGASQRWKVSIKVSSRHRPRGTF